MSETIGFIGVGRIGLPAASMLLEAGYDVVCTRRGRAAELVEKGGRVAGDGSIRAVAEEAAVVFTSLTSESLENAIAGPDGILAADGTPPTIVEMTTAKTAVKRRLGELVAERGSALLDCPVSGTPPMVAAKRAMIFGSGDRAAWQRVEPAVRAISPGAVYVGKLGAGTNMKYVANLCVFIHSAAVNEAMAMAQTLGLDLKTVAEVIASSPGATSGQFAYQAPLIAAGQFEGNLATVAETRDVIDQVMLAAGEVGAWTPVLSLVKELYDELGEAGYDDAHPARLSVKIRERGESGVVA